MHQRARRFMHQHDWKFLLAVFGFAAAIGFVLLLAR